MLSDRMEAAMVCQLVVLHLAMKQQSSEKQQALVAAKAADLPALLAPRGGRLQACQLVA